MATSYKFKPLIIKFEHSNHLFLKFEYPMYCAVIYLHCWGYNSEAIYDPYITAYNSKGWGWTRHY
jgi:hypothetical protein